MAPPTKRLRPQVQLVHATIYGDDVLARGCLPRRELTSGMLLPEGSEAEIDAGFIGVLGAFKIYRGSHRGHRMANLRVILR